MASNGRIKLGVQLWTQCGTWAELELAAVRVEELGFDSLWTWDHLNPIIGSPEGPQLEAWMTLGAWAKPTRRVTIGLMVGTSPVRNPALVAKMATTLDHISGGRAMLDVKSTVRGTPARSTRRAAAPGAVEVPGASLPSVTDAAQCPTAGHRACRSSRVAVRCGRHVRSRHRGVSRAIPEDILEALIGHGSARAQTCRAGRQGGDVWVLRRGDPGRASCMGCTKQRKTMAADLNGCPFSPGCAPAASTSAQKAESGSRRPSSPDVPTGRSMLRSVGARRPVSRLRRACVAVRGGPPRGAPPLRAALLGLDRLITEGAIPAGASAITREGFAAWRPDGA